ncbi:MAG: alpha/beta fold hydrolase [Planctomycetia bacterium]|nr:alpha/beta fold hydrolase [Planctomycetia bacterium]
MRGTGDWMARYPFRSRWLAGTSDRAECRLHYIDEGEGDPLIFVHGPATWSFHWRELILAFRGRYRTIALDYAGCGLSGLPGPGYRYRPEDRIRELTRLIRRLGLRQVTLIADGVAMVTALGVAAKISRRVARFVLINPIWPSLQNRYGLPILPRIPWRILTSPERAIPGGETDPTIRRGYTEPWIRWRRRCGLWRELCGWRRSVREPGYLASLRRRSSVFSGYPACLICGETELLSDLLFVRPEVHVIPEVVDPVETIPLRLEPILESFFERNPVF